jgi:hypothetical protein
MQETVIFAMVLAPIILALTEAVKKSIKFPSTYVPLVAILIGLVVGYLGTPFTDLPLDIRLWAGVLAALASTGLFELVTPSTGYTKK